MHGRFGLCVALIFIPLIAHAGANPKTVAKPAATQRLEGQSYLKARRSIVSYGWVPLAGNCGGGGTSPSMCRQFVEIANCAGTGVGYCDMMFTRKQRCLTVITKGGAPKDGAVVEDVIFSAAPCRKDQ